MKNFLDDISTERHIKVWNYNEAPKHLRDYSTHCGDEDWVVLAAGSVNQNNVEYLVDRLTVCDFEKHKIVIEDIIYYLYITSHS